MGLLDSNSKRALVESMRQALVESVARNATLTESVQTESVKFVQNDATYEQLLNMTMNPLRESKYLPAHVLEGAVAILSEAMLTGRKVIGMNAVTEGALNLVKKTDCVVTESMLDAALEAAQSNALDVIAESMMIVREDWIDKAEKKLGRKLTPAELSKAGIDSSAKLARDKKKVSGIEATVKKIGDLKAKIKSSRGKVGRSQINKMNGELDKLQGVLAKKAKAAGKKVVDDKIVDNKKATAFAKKGGKLGLAALGLAAGVGAGAYGIKKWHDKKQAQKMAASQYE